MNTVPAATASSEPCATADAARTEPVVVAIVTPLETELVDRIAAVDDRLDIRYQPDLLPPPRFPCDHRGVDSFHRTPEQHTRWLRMLAEAEVLFGLPGDSGAGLADAVRTCPGLRWVQATAGGAGEQVDAAALSRDELQRVQITRAGGVHVGPLAEFAMLGILAVTKDLPRLLADKHAHAWDHYPMDELRELSALLVGIGPIGAEIARLAAAFGMRVLAVNRTGHTDSPDVAETRPARDLDELLPRADAVVITLPLTEQTRGMIGMRQIALMRPDTVVVNVGRGAVIDEVALDDALAHGRLRGAALDVFKTEPLPEDSPLWRLPNVLVSPHTAGLSLHENERIVELFCDNLQRYLRGRELLGLIAPPAAD